MRGEFFDYDPLTGVTETYEETAEGKICLHSYQDVQPALDAAKRLANAGSTDEAWKKQGVAMYASLPIVIVAKMMKDGINIFDQNDMPKVIREVNTTYSAFKTTHKHHSIRNK